MKIAFQMSNARNKVFSHMDIKKIQLFSVHSMQPALSHLFEGVFNFSECNG